MKRDMDLIREILIKMRDHDHGNAPIMKVQGYNDEQIGFHCYLLHDAGLIDAIVGEPFGVKSPQAIPKSLTWHGYEFIENAYDEKIWNESKEVVGKLGSVSFSIWSSVLAQLVAKNIGL